MTIPIMARSGHIQLGKSGEDCACAELTRRGYAILARRYRTRDGEIDIIARDRDTLVFVEVKARRSLRCGAPAEAVDERKRRRLILMASHYLRTSAISLFGPCGDGRRGGLRCRFDVVSVLYRGGEEAPAVEVIRNAFDVP